MGKTLRRADLARDLPALVRGRFVGAKRTRFSDGAERRRSLHVSNPGTDAERPATI
jgi:hypothetical protein